MTTAQGIFLILHFIGLSSLLGGWMVQLTAPVKTASRFMIDGAWLQLLSGVALIGFLESDTTAKTAVDHAKFGVKGLILAVIVILLMQSRKKESIEKGTYFAIGLLTLVNVIIAVLWSSHVAG